MNAERIYRFALWLVIALIPLLIFFLWNNSYSLNTSIDDGKFGTFGDFVGGVLGSIWSLCGVLLFYTALKEQRLDFDINKEALGKQIEALEVQTKEFKLQREELRESRQVFVDQSKTLRQQRLDSTYFSLLALYKQVITDLDEKSGGDYFKKFREDLFGDEVFCGKYDEIHQIVSARYLEFFYKNKQGLSHYFKLIYRIIKIVDDYDIEEIEKFRYVKILRSQLSENELLAMYYNSHSRFGKESYKLILKYNLLKHLSTISKVDFQYFLLNSDEKKKVENGEDINIDSSVGNKSVALMEFNDLFEEYLSSYLISLHSRVNLDEFAGYKVSEEFFGSKGFLVVFESCESNEVKVSIKNVDLDFIRSRFCFDLHDFSRYVESLVFDLLVYSRYIKFGEDESIISELIENGFSVNCTLTKKLKVNSDIE